MKWISPGEILRLGVGTGLPKQIPYFPQGKEPFLPHNKDSITRVQGDPWLDSLPAKAPP